MKKVFLIIILATSLFADFKGLGQLLDKIFPLLTHKAVVKIYTLPKYYQYFYTDHFVIVKNCKKSDIIFGNIKCYNKPVFALNYDFYKKNSDVFGVFYYRKGRPQIKFKKEALIKYFKSVPNEIKGYVQ